MRAAGLALCCVIGWSAVAMAETPRQRAQAVLDAQVAALKKGKAGRGDLVATFADGAVFASTQVTTLANAGAGLGELTGEVPPPNASAKLKSAALDHLEVGGNDDAVWFTVDLTMTYAATPGQPFSMDGSYTFRVTELLAADRGWKPVVIHVYKPSIKDDWQEPGKTVGKIVGAKKLGALGKLALQPAMIHKSLATDTDVFVYGTLANERYIGAQAASKQLGVWSKLKLAVGTLGIEASGKGWGFAVADVRVKQTKRELPMRVFAIALPAEKQSWRFVVVGYNTAY